MIKRNLTLGMALSLALFGSTATAMMGDGDDMSFQVRGFIGNTGYDNSTMKDKEDETYVKADTSFSTSYVFGLGGKFDYYMDSFMFSADAYYRWGNIDLTVDDVKTGADVTSKHKFTSSDQVKYTDLKFKALLGMNVDMGSNAMFSPSIGFGYWSTAYPHDAVTGGTTEAAKLELTTTSMSVPVGFMVKAGMGSDIGFGFSAHYHWLFSAKSSTTHGAKFAADFDKDTANEATEYSHNKGSFSTNYGLQVDAHVMKDLSDTDFGLDSIGVGFHYDYLKLAQSEKASTDYVYGPVTDSQLGAYITLGF